jgi:UDP-4-amino-4,6-dideoxy-N-acetyl-beta-L-altrosamine N-acetyltransferase
MTFIDLTTTDIGLQFIVREWRNHPEIRKNMYTDEIITEEDHEVWLNNLKSTKKTKVYIAYKDSLPIGIVSISNINSAHLMADWAFYLNPQYLNTKGLGTLMEYHFLNYIFDNLNIIKLNCEVLETNPSVITLHKKFGFTEEGIRRKNIIKNNNRVDVYLLGILKEEWNQMKNNFTKIIERLEK